MILNPGKSSENGINTVKWRKISDGNRGGHPTSFTGSLYCLIIAFPSGWWNVIFIDRNCSARWSFPMIFREECGLLLTGQTRFIAWIGNCVRNGLRSNREVKRRESPMKWVGSCLVSSLLIQSPNHSARNTPCKGFTFRPALGKCRWA